MSSWEYWSPTGIIIRPPTASWLTKGVGMPGAPAVTIIPSKGLSSGPAGSAVRIFGYNIVVMKLVKKLAGI